MKRKLLIAFAILGVCGAQAETSYKLSEAIQKKLVNVVIAGAKADTSGTFISSHVGACMAMEITSASTDALNLSLEYGYLLVPVDSSVQTMIVTQNLIVKLQPKQKKNYRIYAMCTEAHDGGPNPDRPFYMGKRATGNLLNLAELVNRKKYQNNAAQNAVWCLTDDYALTSIFDDDTTIMYDLRRFVAKTRNLPMASIYETNSGSAPVTTFRTRTVYSGSLTYSYSTTSKIMIALFDEDNHMKKVYVNVEAQRPGEYTYNYQIGSDEMSDKKHYLRMFRNGRLTEEIAIIPHE